MLTDMQLDELERALFLAHRADIPLVVGKLLPVLFAELRVTRAALDLKAEDFLRGHEHDLSGPGTEGPGGDSAGDGRGLPVRHADPGSAEEVVAVAQEVGVDGSAPRRRRSRKSGRRDRPNPRGDRVASGPYEGLVVAGGGEQEMGGEAAAAGGGGGAGAVEDPASLNRACNRCGMVRGQFGACHHCGCPEFTLVDAIEGQMPLPLEGGS